MWKKWLYGGLLLSLGVFSTGRTEAQEAAEPLGHAMYDSITAYTKVGDGQREVYEIEAVLKDPEQGADLQADQFDIVNNVNTHVFQDTDVFVAPYEDDGLTLTVDGNTVNFTFTPFNYNGANEPDANGETQWQFINEEVPELSFTAADVTAVVTETVDDAIIGVHTYAGITREYALYLPKDDKGQPMTNVPLVVWNHGGGEYGGDIQESLVTSRGFSAWPESGHQTAVLQLQVSNPNYSYEAADDPEKLQLIDRNNALQADIIRELIAQGTVDPQRVYITGASSGGGATMRFLMQYPEMVAGSVVIASHDPIVKIHKGTDDAYDVIVSKLEKAFQGTVNTWSEADNTMVEQAIATDALVQVPISFAHAENDTVTLSTSSKAMYEALNNLGAQNNTLTLYSDEQMQEIGIQAPILYHWSWVRVLNEVDEDSIIDWLFEQAKTEMPNT